MNLEVAITFLLGMLVRLGIPVGFTILVIAWLARLDAQWQEEARAEVANLPKRAEICNAGCWDVHKCTPENKAKCPAFNQPEVPCWQLFREKNGALRDGCLGCSVFRTAPVPAST